MRQFRIFLSVLPAMLLSWASTTAYAHRVAAVNDQGVTIYYNYKYTDNGTELEVTYRGSSSYSEYNEYSGEVVIPESVTDNGTTYPVTGIGFYAFAGSDLSSVTIPSTVTEIGYGSFSGCAKLTGVDIPNTVTTLGGNAFSNCSLLESVAIGSSVTTISQYAFAHCPKLKEITIPNTVTTIEEDAFYQCTGLVSVVIGSGVTTIGIGAFNVCRNLTSVTILRRDPPSLENQSTESTFINCANATLYVPYGCKSNYESVNCWKKFKVISELPQPRLPMPTITFTDGKLSFADEVEGVTFQYGIYQQYEQTTSSTEPIAFPFNHVYIVQALAMKEGWLNSGIAEITVDLSDLKGDANGDGIISIADITIILENILNQ